MIPKFRAWDSEANIMIYSDHRTRKLYDVYYGFEMNGKGELECRWEDDFTESQVLDGGILDNIMQSTGLKDKNGVEIFEGDIVRHSEVATDISIVRFGEFGVPNIEEQSYQDCAVGFYYENASEFKDIEPFNMTVPLNSDYVKGVLVIGNIHENPELLSSGIE